MGDDRGVDKSPFVDLVDDDADVFSSQEEEVIDTEETIEENGTTEDHKKNIPDSDQKKDETLSNKSKVDKKKSKKTIIIAGISVAIISILLLIGSMVYGAYQDVVSNQGRNSYAAQESPSLEDKNVPSASINDAGAGQPTENYLSSKYGESKLPVKNREQLEKNVSGNVPAIPVEVSANTGSSTNNEMIEDQGDARGYEDIQSSGDISGAEDELYGVGNNTFKESGGVCTLSAKYPIDREYVYYRYDGSEYVLVSKEKDWDKKGYIFNSAKIVAESFDKRNKFVEVSKGKFLPSEMFRDCRSL